MALEPFETAEAEDFPTCRQLSVFLENRVGQLHRLVRVFGGTRIRILAISVIHSVDCAIVRLVLDKTDDAIRYVKNAGFAVSVSDLVVVALPQGDTGIQQICTALLSAEVNIFDVYPLLTHPLGAAALALKVDNLSMAARVLKDHDFAVLSESDLDKDQGMGPASGRLGQP
jgi:hypothetical protein